LTLGILQSVLSGTGLFWILFGVLVTGMLALDLLVFHRKSHAVSTREAVVWSIVWIGLAVAFGVCVCIWRGRETGMQFFTGYFIEKSLSVDNLFVFVVLFSYFAVAAEHQHKVLFWGIIGALIMRAVFIAAGLTLIRRFHWTIYVFGVILVITGVKLLFKKKDDANPDKNLVIRLFRRIWPVAPASCCGEFFAKHEGRWKATTLFVALLAVETTDVVFAVDSVPAVLAISNDPFVVYTSNVFAILGLRALYFALAGVLSLLRYLNYGLAAVLVFVGAKMMLTDSFKISALASLGVVLGLLAVSAAASIVLPSREAPRPPMPGDAPPPAART
jgi:tellurite resistance protein TerC